jgi:hypothetical protein
VVVVVVVVLLLPAALPPEPLTPLRHGAQVVSELPAAVALAQLRQQRGVLCWRVGQALGAFVD